MPILQLQEKFVTNILDIYGQSEAQNIFYLAMEHLTGINLRQNSNAHFNPDGCFEKMLNNIQKRLKQHEPIQYILNEAWFYDISFYVDKQVLIPRPETEELVNLIVKTHHQNDNLTILDIGTGSGCIPIILKKKLPAAKVYSCDISKNALSVAQKNARKHQTEIQFIEMDFLDSNNWTQLPEVDLMVSNPPYIPETDKSTMRSNVLLHEPHETLFVSSDDPLLFYRATALAGKQLINTGGTIYVEIHESYGNECCVLFKNHGYTATLKQDMQYKDRFVIATL